MKVVPKSGVDGGTGREPAVLEWAVQEKAEAPGLGTKMGPEM
ncbi:MAG TPA: hypothetical protein PLX02_12265 [Syntrophorhabdaceae bacterium]|nr:hypothetical protein [Syntrophorhabdaceae bacterium]